MSPIVGSAAPTMGAVRKQYAPFPPTLHAIQWKSAPRERGADWNDMGAGRDGREARPRTDQRFAGIVSFMPGCRFPASPFSWDLLASRMRFQSASEPKNLRLIAISVSPFWTV